MSLQQRQVEVKINQRDTISTPSMEDSENISRKASTVMEEPITGSTDSIAIKEYLDPINKSSDSTILMEMPNNHSSEHLLIMEEPKEVSTESLMVTDEPHILSTESSMVIEEFNNLLSDSSTEV
jgi:isocitrate/isopropylmalate dehydrogenase